MNRARIAVIASTMFFAPLSSFAQTSLSLDGPWVVSLDGRQNWTSITVPGTVEDQIDVGFDGTSIYRKEFAWPNAREAGQRILLQFDAVATKATISLNGKEMGSHLGGWTPFEFDITDDIRSGDRLNQLEVLCDELVGHNTQGFLPVFAPHFGGIWKGVRVVTVPRLSIDSNRVGVHFDSQQKNLEIEVPLRGLQDGDAPRLRFHWRKKGDEKWQLLAHAIDSELGGKVHQKQSATIYRRTGNTLRVTIDLEEEIQTKTGTFEYWSPANPALYELQIGLESDGQIDGVISQEHVYRVGLREFKTDGDRFLLNGRPVNIRGLLNWGYAPPSVGPTVNETVMREEIELARSRGFNLMKFCLWIPPQRYLELCDELGMLAWIEYPAWHPDFSNEKLTSLLEEYNEFFEYDRNHPSVIVRSLTCETGHSADIDVVRQLYDLCKSRIPGAVVEDDSSWIEWNRIHDFYDDHPYGNNHTWVDKLSQLKHYIVARDAKPLLLGEAIAADTWCNPVPILDQVESRRPFWLPQFLDGNAQWMSTLQGIVADEAIENLYADSRRYAMLMRKYQIETFRREVPGGGYVVSVIRDIPFCGMGLVDYLNQSKFTVADWEWHGDNMICLESEHDVRSFLGGQSANFVFHLRLKHGTEGEPLRCKLNLAWEDSNLEIDVIEELVEIKTGSSSVGFKPDLPAVIRPTRVILTATLHTANNESVVAKNSWPLWIVPRAKVTRGVSVRRHSSVNALPIVTTDNSKSGDSIVVTHVIDMDLINHIRNGGQVVLIPNNQPNSLPTKSHWFLRGGPLVDNQRIFPDIPRDFFVELQHFDLAGNVVPNVQNYLTSIQPLLVLWDNHDLKTVNTHGLMYRIGSAGKGGIFVTAIDHERSPAGRFLFAELLNSIAKKVETQPAADNQELLIQLERELKSRSIRLEQKSWKFKPDPEHNGRLGSVRSFDFDDSNWPNIRIDQHWESQGYDTLDGWAWYRIKVDLPSDWPADQVYLNFSGVDDHYRVHVNGQYIGQSGDIAKRQTAFDERKSYLISEQVTPGKPVQIAIEVFDWYGAGGIFRPVTLTTEPVSDVKRILK